MSHDLFTAEIAECAERMKDGLRTGLSASSAISAVNKPSGWVLVTGAGGFVGSHLAEDQLRRGLRVRAVDLRLDALAGTEDERLDRAVMDVTDPQGMEAALRGMDVVFHLASKHLEVGVPDAEYRRINVEGTRQLLELSARAGVTRFVYCSTTGLMGHIAEPPADEDAPPKPEIIYERTKWEAEELVREFGQRGAIETVIVRPAWVYGPRCPRTEKLFRAAREGRFLMVGHGRCLRHAVFIDDMCAGFHLAATVSAAAGRTYIIAGDRPVTIRELVERVGQTVGRHVRIVTLPRAAAGPLFRAIEMAFIALGKTPPVSQRSLKFYTQQTAYDITRARRELGFEPAISLDEGLRRTWEVLSAASNVAPIS